jgi:hypothetical protein
MTITEPLPALSGRSLRWKLMAPMALFWTGLAMAAIVGLRWEAERRLEQSLVQRAEVLANLIDYSAESAATPAELQRFVTRASAELDVVAIAVAAGQPARVLAGSRDAWRGLLVSELPHDGIADDLEHAIASRASHRHFHTDVHRFDYSAPLPPNLRAVNGGSRAPGAVALHLDTQRLQDELTRSAAIIAGATAFTLLGFRVLHRVSSSRRRATRDDAVGADTPVMKGARRDAAGSIREHARSVNAALFRAHGGHAAGGAAQIHAWFVNDSVHFLRDTRTTPCRRWPRRPPRHPTPRREGTLA